MKTRTQSNNAKPIGGIELVKVVREFHPLTIDPDIGQSFGAIVDEMIVTNLKEGHELQSFRVEIDPEHWMQLAKDFHSVNRYED